MGKPLTALAVEKAKAGSTRREIADGLLPGLYLLVQPSGKKSWAVRYRLAGKPQKLTLGPFPTLRLGEARDEARNALQQVARGEDPGLTRKAAAQRSRRVVGDTFEKIAERFIEEYAKPNTKENTWYGYERNLIREVVPVWRGRSVESITRRDVKELLSGIVARGTPVLANRVLSVVRLMFGWCLDEDIIEASPIGRMKAPGGKEHSRTRVLSDAEIRALWRASDRLTYPFGPFWKLLLLSGQREGDVAQASWREFDPARSVWTIPPLRHKSGLPHLVPLTPAIADLLSALPRFADGEFLFSTTGGARPISGFTKVKQRMDELIAEETGNVDHWVIHDVRRTMRTRLSALHIKREVAELLIGHGRKGIEKVYDLHEFLDEMREALAAWGRLVDSIVSDKPSDNVVALRGAS